MQNVTPMTVAEHLLSKSDAVLRVLGTLSCDRAMSAVQLLVPNAEDPAWAQVTCKYDDVLDHALAAALRARILHTSRPVRTLLDWVNTINFCTAMSVALLTFPASHFRELVCAETELEEAGEIDGDSDTEDDLLIPSFLYILSEPAMSEEVACRDWRVQEVANFCSHSSPNEKNSLLGILQFLANAGLLVGGQLNVVARALQSTPMTAPTTAAASSSVQMHALPVHAE